MKKRLSKKIIPLLIGAVWVLAALSSCDYWISNEIEVENNTGSTVTFSIYYNDGSLLGPSPAIGPGGSYTFHVSYYDSDKYGAITIIAHTFPVVTHQWESKGNITENDWVILVDFDGESQGLKSDQEKGRREEKENRIAATDCVIALSYFDLAAITAGLGCCWAGLLMMAAASYPPMIEELALPENLALKGALMVGYPKYRYTRIPARKPANIVYRK